MRAALITGASGFIGQHLISELLACGYKIFALDSSDKNPFENNPDVTYIQSSLSDVKSISVPPCEVLYHLAWRGVAPDLRNNMKTQKENVDLSLSAVELAKEIGIPKAVFIGSTMEYCFAEGEISENSTPTPLNCYGAAKLAARFLSSSLAKNYKIDFRYAVITSIYGPGRDDGSLICYCIKEILSGRAPKLTEAIQRWDFIHIKDAVRALRLIGEKGEQNGFYTVGCGENKKLSEYVGIISRLSDESVPLLFGAIPYGKSGVPHSAVDTEKLKRDTGFKPEYTFSEGIRELVNFYKQKLNL